MLTKVLNKNEIFSNAIQSEKTTPVVSLFMLFEPKMVAKGKLTYKLQLLVNEAEQKLINSFPFAVAEHVLNRLKSVVKSLDYSTHKKSIAIYVSKEKAKIYYLNLELEDRIIINESFHIRKLIESQKNLQCYILLVLSTNMSKIYFGKGEHLLPMVSNTRGYLTTKESGNIENIYTPADNTASIIDFLNKTDNNLNIVLGYFSSLPLIVAGNYFILDKYKIITKNETHITQLLETASDEINIDEIRTALDKYIQNWDHIKMQDLHRRLDNAMDSNKIAVGIENVIKAVTHKRPKLLVLEKDFTYPVVKAEENRKLSQSSLFFTDTVDEVIEIVLMNEGEVTFANKEVLEDYQHIALIYH
jgi:ribosomal protein L30E